MAILWSLSISYPEKKKYKQGREDYEHFHQVRPLMELVSQTPRPSATQDSTFNWKNEWWGQMLGEMKNIKHHEIDYFVSQ